MQFQVPQNITMEDRIIGPITTIQFVILIGGGMVAFFILNQSWLPGDLETWLAGATALLVAIIALGRFNDQPLYKFGRFIMSFILSPKVRIWHKGSPPPVLVSPSEHKNEERHRVQKRVSRLDIAQVAQVVDTRGRSGVNPSVKQK